MQAFDVRAKVLTEYLQSLAGVDHRTDAFNSGYICAVKDLLLIELDTISEEK